MILITRERLCERLSVVEEAVGDAASGQWSRANFSGSTQTKRLSSMELRKQLTNWLLLQRYQKKPCLRQIVIPHLGKTLLRDW